MSIQSGSVRAAAAPSVTLRFLEKFKTEKKNRNLEIEIEL
jgi:hypothetical protein